MFPGTLGCTLPKFLVPLRLFLTFFSPKYPGLAGYPGYRINDIKEIPASGLDPTRYDRYYIQQSDHKLRHFHQQSLDEED